MIGLCIFCVIVAQIHYDFGLRAVKAVVSVGRANLIHLKR